MEDLAGIAVELYALVPSAFTAARSARAKDAKSSGDKELAQQITRLPKPSTSAWAVNLLVRNRAKEFAGVLELGTALAAATEQQDAERLRTLGQQRPRVLAAAVEQARNAAEGQGVKVSGAAAMEVEATLRAAMSDPGAAGAVRSGRLVRALSTDGIEAVDLTDAVAVPDSLMEPLPVPSIATPAELPDDGGRQRVGAEQEREREKEREKARAALAEAERTAEEADVELAKAEREKDEAMRRGERLAADVKAAKDKLAALQQELASTEWAVTVAERNRRVAARQADRGHREAEMARRRVAGLG
ncbi:hypothetical protein [Arthrobacter sp. NyZ413]|uniref:hypothetical protein n=1 Tax=Arthrobacter sp. NyZ413 TaxID=3144669 RepID=UPI003BF8079B